MAPSSCPSLAGRAAGRSPVVVKKKNNHRNKAAKAVLVLSAIPTPSNSLCAPIKRTVSFEALCSKDPHVKVHTLILGTHPSVTSLEKNKYFGHPMNAFWWIAGDCLGFQRAKPLTVKGTPYKFAADLRGYDDNIIPYDEQTELFCSKGFALWDVVGSCERKGSLDQDIKREIPNNIRGFCKHHPHLQRIVLANGGTACSMFLKHFKDWWLEGELVPGDNEESQKAFGKIFKKVEQPSERVINCISALSVSPAAAKYNYKMKRDFWDRYIYQPGLRQHMALSSEGDD